MPVKPGFFLLFLCYTYFLPAQDAGLATVKERVFSQLFAAPPDVPAAREYHRSQREDGTWTDIDYTDLSRTGFQHRLHLDRLLIMTLAYRHLESSLAGDKALLAGVTAGLRHWAAKDYIGENWWHNQIFTPRVLAQIALLLEEELPAALLTNLEPIIGRAHLDATGARPGGDRMKVGGTLALATLRKGNAAAFRRVMDSFGEQVKFTTGVRGIQADYSFHHRIDRVNNTVSYGKGYADNFAEWAAYVADTPFAFAEGALRILVDYYLDGIVKQHIFGKYADAGVLNRSNSRPRTFSPAGTKIAENLLTATDYRADELRQVIALRRGETSPQASFCRFFWQTEHFVCQRPGWYASVRMHSIRNANMEVPYNEEGFKNHHRGDGANHLHRRGDEYLNVWPVYDYQKIPGTTVLQKDTLYPESVQKYGLTSFVGAVTDGTYGAVGYDFISPHDGTKARKAWFFFDEEYICLGAGIEAQDHSQPVVTTLEQRLLTGPVTAGWLAGISNPPGLKQSSPDWVHHDSTGYQFLEGTSQLVSMTKASRTGRWTDINRQWDSPREPVTEDIFQLWIDHGPRPHGRPGGLNHADMRPKDVGYAYAIVPNVSVKDMEQRDQTVHILANNRWLQAVYHPKLRQTQVIAYRGEEVDLFDGQRLVMDTPGALLIRQGENGRLQQLTVADPSRRKGALHFSLPGDQRSASGQHTSHYDSATDRTHFRVVLPQGELAGSSVILHLPE
ncbi:MAG: polysaccharide lyase family 8 super-sandwich domain-containing protein [Bacteroidota bacterium]